MYIGSCQHYIDEEWYNSDDSTYIIVDKETGITSNVTTCPECKRANEEAGVIVDEPIVDDFDNPFEDDPAPREMNVVNPDGTVETVFIDEDVKEISLEEWSKQK